MNKVRIFNLILVALLLLGTPFFSQAQNEFLLDYAGQPVLDSDLDGLTDEGELKIFRSDPGNADTDGDGYLDGAEILSGSGVLDINSTPLSLQIGAGQKQLSQQETPWAWYLGRISGLVAFVLLYLSIFLGLSLRLRFLHKLFAPLYALNAHAWIALQATILALAHGLILTLDKFFGLSLLNVLVPFTSSNEAVLVGLGTISFYLMLLLVVTSYARKHLSHALWRALHFLNIGLYIIVVVHALYLGTDLKAPSLAQDVFIAANELLVLLMLVNMFLRIKDKIQRRNMLQNNQSNNVQ